MMWAALSRLALIVCLVLNTASLRAAEWPDHFVRFIVPFAAGGSGDTLARVVALHLSAALKQQFVIENHAGASGIIGTQQFLAAAPDGYTIGQTSLSTISLVPVINPTKTYDPVGDFTHIAYIGGAPVVLAANPQTGVKTFNDFIAYCNQPEKSFAYASSGVGSDGHLAGVAIGQSAKVRVQHIPYKSTAQALTDLVAGHIPFSTFTLSSTAPFLRSHAVNGIAVTTPERLPEFPDIPTFKELGHPELAGTTWFGVAGPAQLPKQIVDILNREVIAAVSTPEMQGRLRREGFVTQAMSADEFTRYVSAENAKWNLLIKRAGLLGQGQ